MQTYLQYNVLLSKNQKLFLFTNVILLALKQHLTRLIVKKHLQ